MASATGGGSQYGIIGTNGETLRDKNKLAYSCHQAFPILPLSDPLSRVYAIRLFYGCEPSEFSVCSVR